jgi:hypothetical protein
MSPGARVVAGEGQPVEETRSASSSVTTGVTRARSNGGVALGTPGPSPADGGTAWLVHPRAGLRGRVPRAVASGLAGGLQRGAGS